MRHCDIRWVCRLYLPFTIPQGYFNELNARLKKNSDLPVVAFGKIKPTASMSNRIRSPARPTST